MAGKYKIEICANSVESAINAQKAGAYRVELCAGIPEGGTTPSFGTIIRSRELLKKTRLNVIVRPRGGDFMYSKVELEEMFYDVDLVYRSEADGVVFGCLTADGDIDMPAMRKLVEIAGDMNMTFHRAFDMCRDPFEAMEQLIDLGIHRILTSGQETTAEAGIPLLRSLVERAAGRIIIMPGCGINAGNIRKIAQETGATEFHFSGRSPIQSGMLYRNPKVSMGGTVHIDEYLRDVTDPEKVRAAMQQLS